MTNQEIFDKVSTHLLTQKEKSLASNPRGEYDCAYRGTNGLKCAIGCLIDDDHYEYEMEGQNVFDLIEGDFDLGFDVTLDNRDLLLTLQETHDTFRTDHWEESLRGVAIAYGLEANF